MSIQGSNAQKNGKKFEQEVKDFLKDNNINIKKMLYESLDHNKNRRGLDVFCPDQKLAIECKSYKGWGSKIQNYTWDIQNAKMCVPCVEYIAVWDFEDTAGSGKILICFERAVEMAEQNSTNKKVLKVLKWKEFKEYINDRFNK